MPLFSIKNGAPIQSVASDEDIINFLNPADDLGGRYVSAREALHNSDIYSLVFQISSDLANSKLLADKSGAQGLLNCPSKTTNGNSFWKSMFAQLLLGGECFAYRFRNKNGIDYRWEYLRPSQVSPFLLGSGTGLIYNLTFDEPEIGIMQNVPQDDLIHIRLLSQNGGMTGISPLTALASEIHIKNDSNRLTLNALKQSVTTFGVIHEKSEAKMSDPLKKARSSMIKEQMKNGVLVLDALEEFEPIQIKSNVAALLNQVNWTGKQIAKVYGVPDSVINGAGDQQSSIQMENTVYVKALSRFTNAITAELTQKLNANVKMDVRSAVDPIGDSYAGAISDLTRYGALAPNQATVALQEAGFLSKDLPNAKWPSKTQQKKGGENNGNS